MTLFKKVQRIILILLKYASLILGSFVSIVPIAVCVITAFKTKEEYMSTNVMTLPNDWSYLENFKIAWEKANMGKAFLNSLIIMIVVLAGSIMIGTILAYVLDRFQFRGNGLIRNLFLFATLLPGIAMQVTVYQIMYKLNLVDTMIGYIILMMGTDVIAIYIFLQFFENIQV